MTQLLELVLELCKEKMSDLVYKVWLSDLVIISIDHSQVHLETPNDFKHRIIQEKYLPVITETFQQVLGFPLEVRLTYRYKTQEAMQLQNGMLDPAAYMPTEDSIDENQTPLSVRQTAMPTPNLEEGDYEYTFSTFIVGSSNKFAHAAALAVANNPAKAYNPLFIYGNSGLGKTHLLHAIQLEIQRTHPDFNLIYIKGDDFANELIEAIKTKTNVSFREKYRRADVLLVDDIQFIGGKDSTQEEFFHTFNTLYEARKQIVLASDRPPKEIKTLEERLRTRFESGLLADIQTPDFETRIAIIRRKAQLMSLTLPDDVADYIADRLKTNIRQLEGVVKKIKFQNEFHNINPSILSAQNAIKDILNDNVPIPITIERIINEVARSFNIPVADVRSNKRTPPISSARQASMYIVRDITGLSTTSIGEEFGRDHSTVVYAIKQAEKNITSDPYFKATVEDIIKNIRSS